MSHYHHFIEGVCENCGERKHDIDIESAERAIVEAADTLRSEVDGDGCVALFARRQDELFRAVDHWRKLKGGA